MHTYRPFARLGAILVLGCLAGCGGPPEERITEAFPIGPSVVAAKGKLLAAAKAGGGDTAKLEGELVARVKVRALECAGGYEPGALDDAKDIAEELADKKPCFDAQDERLLAFIGERRIGMLAAAMPLRPLPRAMPRFVAPSFVSSVLFARRAGVALTADVSDSVALLDINNGSLIWQGEGDSPGALSPNGRVFGTWERGKGTTLRESESGDLLLTLPDVMPYQVHWVGDFGLLHKVPDEKQKGRSRLVFRDLTTGLVSNLDAMGDEVEFVVPVAGTSDRFWTMHFNRVYQVAFKHGPEGWKPTLATQQQMSGMHSSNASAVSADGRNYLRAHGEQLLVMDLATGQVREEQLAPFEVHALHPIADPDGVLLLGSYQGTPGAATESLVYSLARRTLAVVDPQAVPKRSFFVPSLAINANIDNQAVMPAPIEVSGVPGDIATVVAARQVEVLAFLQARMGAPVAPGAGPYGLAATRPVVDSRPQVIKGPVAALAANSRIVGIGVYDGTRVRGQPYTYATRGGTVQVRVMRTKRPIILVLAAYDPVSWVVTTDPGAVIGAILLSGPNGAQAMGSHAPVHHIGSAWASSGGEGDMRTLESDVYRWTGKAIDAFHGKHDGDQFFLRE